MWKSIRFDRSGSMGGAKWDACCRAFREFLKQLAPQDRAWVTFFESSFRDLAEKPLPPAAILAEPAVQNLEALGVAGGTELLPALQHVLENWQRHSAGRESAIVLITDGQVGNEAAVLEVMARSAKNLRVHTFGIDNAVNDAFLKRLAEQQRGSCTLATPHDDLVGMISKLGSRLRKPVVYGLEPPEGWELPGDPLPDLHEDEALTVVLRGSMPAVGPLIFRGRSVAPGVAPVDCPGGPLATREKGSGLEAPLDGPSAGRANATPALRMCANASGEMMTLTVNLVPVPDEAPRLLWQRGRIRWLEAHSSHGEAVKLAVEANLLSAGTAFVAWDETERLVVSAPNLEVYQPAMYAGIERATLVCARSADVMPCFAAPGFSRGDSYFSKLSSAEGPRKKLRENLRKILPGRLRESPQPLVTTATDGGWADALRRLKALQSPAGAKIIEWLEHWLLSDPLQSSVREAALQKLACDLDALPPRKVFDALQAWIELHLASDPAFRRPILAVMQKEQA